MCMCPFSQKQQLQVAAFCSKHHRSKPKNIFPVRRDQRQQLFRHLIYDDKHRFIFCFVEKVGCTDMKRLLFVNIGILPKETINWNWVDSKTFLDRALRKRSFTNANLTISLKKMMIQDYYKTMFVRNPLERLLSAYRNKIEPPLNTLSTRFPNYLKREILETYQPLQYQAWLKSNASYGLNVSFPDFVRYLIDTPNTELNPHLRPQVHICHPCRIRYSFYGNFKTISDDAAMVMQRVQAKPEYYPDRSLHSHATQTKNYLHQYFSQLSVELSNSLFEDWLEELDFYYHLYPEEKDSHKDILGVDKDVL